MLIDWQPDGRPDAALRIAEHTARVIDAMDRATSKTEIKTLFDDWMRFARDHRACSQICEHMVSKRRVLLGDMEKPRKAAERPARTDITSRMMGEGGEAA